MELLAALHNCLRDRSSNTAALVAQQSQQSHRGATKLGWDVNERCNVERGKDGRQTHDKTHSRPDDLPWTDFQIQFRHPVTADSKYKKTRGDEITRIDAAAQSPPDDHEHD